MKLSKWAGAGAYWGASIAGIKSPSIWDFTTYLRTPGRQWQLGNPPKIVFLDDQGLGIWDLLVNTR